jgi:hypothetical protein
MKMFPIVVLNIKQTRKLSNLSSDKKNRNLGRAKIEGENQ